MIKSHLVYIDIIKRKDVYSFMNIVKSRGKSILAFVLTVWLVALTVFPTVLSAEAVKRQII